MRVDAGLTQAEATEALNCSIDKIQWIEGKGSSTATFRDLEVLADLYGFDVGDVRVP